MPVSLAPMLWLVLHASQGVRRVMRSFRAECAVQDSSMAEHVQVSSYADLKAFLIRYADTSAGAIPRSALHMAVCGKAARAQGEVPGPWVPCAGMICGAARLPASGLPGPEAELFVQQAELAVSGAPFT